MVHFSNLVVLATFLALSLGTQARPSRSGPSGRLSGSRERLAPPEGACGTGCADGEVCRPDKDLCDRETVFSDASCWVCAVAGEKMREGKNKMAERKGERPTPPEGACGTGCADGEVCRPDKDLCDRETVFSDASCWVCAVAGEKMHEGKNKMAERKGERPTPPEGACGTGCADGEVCRPDKDLCDRETVFSDASCWVCSDIQELKNAAKMIAQRRNKKNNSDPELGSGEDFELGRSDEGQNRRRRRRRRRRNNRRRRNRAQSGDVVSM